MKIEFEGRTWQVDIDDLGVKQALAITAFTGGTLTAWETSLADVESPGWLAAMQCLYWLMRVQNGETLYPGPGDADFAVLKFSRAVADAIEAEAKAEQAAKAADPTKAASPPTKPPVSPAAMGPRKTPAAG